MKLKIAALLFFWAMVVVNFQPQAADADADSSAEDMQPVTAFSYHAGPGDSRQTARALALFGAKYKAVLLSADHLAGRGLLKDYADRQMEIFCLVADKLQYSVLDDSFSEKDRTAITTIKSSVSLDDFVRAEIRNAEFEKKEANFSLQEEMEPAVSPTIAPAQELSRAYRYIRNIIGEWQLFTWITLKRNTRTGVPFFLPRQWPIWVCMKPIGPSAPYRRPVIWAIRRPV
jgi:hypothetical protein